MIALNRFQIEAFWICNWINKTLIICIRLNIAIVNQSLVYHSLYWASQTGSENIRGIKIIRRRLSIKRMPHRRHNFLILQITQRLELIVEWNNSNRRVLATASTNIYSAIFNMNFIYVHSQEKESFLTNSKFWHAIAMIISGLWYFS